MKMLKYLRLSGLLNNWDKYLDDAKQGNFSNVRLLKHIIEQEYNMKRENSRKIRLSRAKIPEKYIMDTFPFSQQPKIKKKDIINLYDRFDYMTKSQNIIWLGPTGAGKTGLATAFLINAINCGYNGRFILFPELIEILYQSLADHSDEKIIKMFASTDTLL